ncbi:synaptotagmin-7-like [Limulus polyphemus]|uniref:Synaptotagmin-7-like n=1 Tax=Limulus polyphemus TaxID=6850 RepID=A0ABM1RWP3_LIMPO|nr:synaptotagmin-7-like [Limulus polyphemus]XP_022235804.1 synaptotagmin-7-like [Limulus polyphemus]
MMDMTTIIVASVLGTLAALVSMSVTLFLCYIYCRKIEHKKTARDELESLQFGKSPPTGQADEVKELSRHNVEDRIQQGLIPSLVGPSASHPMLITEDEKENTSTTIQGPISFLHSLLPSAEQQEEAADLANAMAEPDDPAGQIQFSLEYNFSNSTLALKIIQGRDLPAKDIIGTSDPYVKVYLLPDKKHKLETKVKHRTLNPRWNETLYFEGYPLYKLQKSILYLHVFDYDRFTRDDPIGDVYLPLSQFDLTQKPTFWKSIKPAEDTKLGEILVTLIYIPRTSELSISLIKARNLKAKDINGSSDPYVKVWLHRGDKRVEKKKTKIHNRTLNPVFNETFQFIVPWEHIRETYLSVTVMDFDTIGRNEHIGKVILSSRSGPTESKHWCDMLAKARTAISQWHRLKAL